MKLFLWINTPTEYVAVANSQAEAVESILKWVEANHPQLLGEAKEDLAKQPTEVHDLPFGRLLGDY